MLRIVLTCFLALNYSILSFSQEKMDVLYLQDGSVLNAYILKEDSASLTVRLLSGDTLHISFPYIHKIIEDNIAVLEVEKLIERNKIKEPSRFLNGSGFLFNMTQSNIFGNSFPGSPFRPFTIGVDFGLGYWFKHRFYFGTGASVENSSNGNAIFYAEHRLNLQKTITTPYLYVKGAYSLELNSSGPQFTPFVSNYRYTGYRGPAFGGGLGYRIELSNYLLMRLEVGYRYMNLVATESWDDFLSKTNAQIHRVAISIGLSF